MMRKTWSMLIAAFLSMVLFASVASAHVTVQPREVTQGSYQMFTVRVPTEKDIHTVKVEVQIPADDVSISRFEPKPGWEYEISRDENGRIVGVTWTATGPGLSPTEFGDFHMQGRVADDAEEIVWKAYQTYEDGSVVEWVGAAGSAQPASVTKVVPPASDEQDNSSWITWITLIISIAAFILSVIALIRVARKN